MSANNSELHHKVEQLNLKRIPLACPSAPKLSSNIEQLKSIEQSNWLSNYGPVNTQLEREFIQSVFRGRGACTTVNNATTGLILALKLAADRAVGKGRYVVMPSFTFAAAAHAVLWAGLTPLLVDIDPFDWAACRAGEEQLLREYGDDIALLMPYATFGSNIDLARYERLATRPRSRRGGRCRLVARLARRQRVGVRRWLSARRSSSRCTRPRRSGSAKRGSSTRAMPRPSTTLRRKWPISVSVPSVARRCRA